MLQANLTDCLYACKAHTRKQHAGSEAPLRSVLQVQELIASLELPMDQIEVATWPGGGGLRLGLLWQQCAASCSHSKLHDLENAVCSGDVSHCQHHHAEA